MKEYIERESLLEECDESISNIQFTSPYQNDVDTMVCGMEHIRDMIYDATAADVAPVRHGEWIYNRGQAYGEPLYFCSLCAEGGSEYGKDNYCPHCGAKMDGGLRI